MKPIGAGEMAERCVRLLVKKGVRSIFISSRSFDRAIDLANRCGGDAVCFGYCLFEMRDVDVVVAATSSGQTLLVQDDIENLMKARRNRPLLLIDLSVPRNIDPAASQLENITLYNIDDLEVLAREGVRNREQEVAACDEIIDSHVAALVERISDKNRRVATALESMPVRYAQPRNIVFHKWGLHSGSCLHEQTA